MATGNTQQQQQQQLKPAVVGRPRVGRTNQKKKNDSGILCDLFRSKHVDNHKGDVKKIVIIFLHGFSGNREHLHPHAKAIIQQHNAAESSSSSSSVVVEAFLPDLIPLTEGGTLKELWIDHNVRSAQVANVEQVFDHVKHLSPFDELILVGHSAGGAIALEAAVALQNTNKESVEGKLMLQPPSMVVLLDAVPWEETIDIAPQLDVQKTRLVSFRCEPSSWNKDGIMERFISSIKDNDDRKKEGRIVDVKIVGAKHGDALPPMFMGKFIGVMTAGGFETMSELTLAALSEGLSMSKSSEEKDNNATERNLETVIKSLETQGKLVRST